MFPKYTQKTCESCLAVCLLLVTGKIKKKKLINKNLELKMLFEALKFSKQNFVIGHLNFITKEFDVNVETYVDNANYHKFLKKLNKSSSVSIHLRRVSKNFLDKLLDLYPIVYIDYYVISKVTHYPHFVIVFEKKDKMYKLFDPWDGKEKLVREEVLIKGIKNLRNLLKFVPHIIVVKNKKQ